MTRKPCPPHLSMGDRRYIQNPPAPRRPKAPDFCLAAGSDDGRPWYSCEALEQPGFRDPLDRFF